MVDIIIINYISTIGETSAIQTVRRRTSQQHSW